MLRPIADVAASLGLPADAVVPYGAHKAKVDLAVLEEGPPRGRLVLVSAITPTKAGEGKTTVSVGLAMGFQAIGVRSAVCLREPSLGPVFGIKGGGTGGGRAQVEPADEINLHFTGDIHAIGAAHNLLAALVDNELHFGGERLLDPRRVTWPRVLDMNDRALRAIVVGLGGRTGGVPRESRFDITAASEVMAIHGLSESMEDLERRLGRIVVGRDRTRRPVTAADLGAPSAMAVLLREAIRPNLVQTREGTPAFVHGGPFANIAHGCSSVLATRVALRSAEVVVTEAGFGFDLGGEKFLHIKARGAGLWPEAVVLVATVRALRAHGGGDLAAGFANLDHHLRSVRAFGLQPVVAVNVFPDDTPEDLRQVLRHCERQGVPAAPCRAFAEGGEGATDLARTVLQALRPSAPRFLYEPDAPYVQKIEAVARTLYGASGVTLSPQALRGLREIEEAGLHLPICVAKTPLSLSDDPKRGGLPRGDHDIHVTSVRLSAGAGFVVVLLGDVMTMPGLPREPAARRIRIEDGRAVGLLQGE